MLPRPVRANGLTAEAAAEEGEVTSPQPAENHAEQHGCSKMSTAITAFIFQVRGQQ